MSANCNEMKLQMETNAKQLSKYERDIEVLKISHIEREWQLLGKSSSLFSL